MFSNIVDAHGVLAHELVAVVEGGLEDHVPAERLCGEHVFRRRGVDRLLPGVGGVGHHKAEGEKPFYKPRKVFRSGDE